MSPITCIIEALEGQKGDKKYIQRNSWNCSKFCEKYKLTSPPISMNPKHEKHKGNYTKVHHNQIAFTKSVKSSVLKAVRKEDIYRGTKMKMTGFLLESMQALR